MLQGIKSYWQCKVFGSVCACLVADNISFDASSDLLHVRYGVLIVMRRLSMRITMVLIIFDNPKVSPQVLQMASGSPLGTTKYLPLLLLHSTVFNPIMSSVQHCGALNSLDLWKVQWICALCSPGRLDHCGFEECLRETPMPLPALIGDDDLDDFNHFFFSLQLSSPL